MSAALQAVLGRGLWLGQAQSRTWEDLGPSEVSAVQALSSFRSGKATDLEMTAIEKLVGYTYIGGS